MADQVASGHRETDLTAAKARIFELEKGLHEFKPRRDNDSEDDSTMTCYWCGNIPKEHGGFGPGWTGSMRCPYPELEDRSANDELQRLYAVVATAEGRRP